MGIHEVLFWKKHPKLHNKQNRHNLFIVINYILANRVKIMKKTLYYKAPSVDLNTVGRFKYTVGLNSLNFFAT